MNQTRIIISGNGMQGSSHNNCVEFHTPSTINNRRQLPRNADVKALNWEELFLHFQEVTQIRKPSTYIEEIRTDEKLNTAYKKKISRKVEHYNNTGMDNIQKYMTEHHVKQTFERYADGSADELLEPMTNVINIGALHNTWIMINPKDSKAPAKIATTETKRDDYLKLGYQVLEHEVDSIKTINTHVIQQVPTTPHNCIRVVKVRRETWTYNTRRELAVLIEEGNETYLRALDWETNTNNKNTPGCLFSKDNYYLMLQHYCSLHLEAVKNLSVHLPWKDFGRKEAVKCKPKDITYLDWAKELSDASPLCMTTIF